MTSRSVAVIGAGPAGLYAARLLKLQRPSWTVRVFERQDGTDTYGFGVGLHPYALDKLAKSDPESIDDLLEIGHPLRTWTIRHGIESRTASNDGGIGVSRKRLLEILRHHAEAAGVVIVSGTSVQLQRLDNVDLVIAADGSSSQARAQLASELGVNLDHGRLSFIWCGATVPIDGMVLQIVDTPAGPLTAHVMPFGNGECTFQIDADIDTVKRLATGGDDLGPDAAEAATLAMLETHFTDLLAGGRLRGNRSRWSTFSHVTCDRWSTGNVVLVGDAAHTAHYTVGSGTRMALEDAAVLVEAVVGEASLADAFATYESLRKPVVERVQWRARRSQSWWSSLEPRLGMPLPRLLLSYLTRTGAFDLAQLVATNRDLVEHAVGSANFDDLAARVLSQRGSDSEDITVAADGVAPWSAESAELVSSLSRSGSAVVALTGHDDRAAILDRIDLAEQIRLSTSARTVVVGPAAAAEDLAIGVLTDRTDAGRIEANA